MFIVSLLPPNMGHADSLSTETGDVWAHYMHYDVQAHCSKATMGVITVCKLVPPQS